MNTRVITKIIHVCAIDEVDHPAACNPNWKNQSENGCVICWKKNISLNKLMPIVNYTPLIREKLKNSIDIIKWGLS